MMLNSNLQHEVKKKGYKWEEGLIRSWELPIENKKNNNEDSNIVDSLLMNAKKMKLEQKVHNNRFGLMRKLLILIDFSESMSDIDFEPSRIDLTLKYLTAFVPEFMRTNPLSNMGIIQLTKKTAQILSNLSGNCAQHLQALQSIYKKKTCKREISILNGLKLALETLSLVPRHFSREILIIMGAVSTCDSDDFTEIIKFMANEGIRVSVISFTAEVHICSKLTRLTNGIYSVAINKNHFRAQLMAHVEPPKDVDKQEKVLIRTGFPHTHELNKQVIKSPNDYECPQCSSKSNELPTICNICGLMLVTVPQLARSYQHLFPVNSFREVAFNAQVALCFACQKEFSMKFEFNIYFCEICRKYFCIDCNIFIHETLHSCVGCSCTIHTPEASLTY